MKMRRRRKILGGGEGGRDEEEEKKENEEEESWISVLTFQPSAGQLPQDPAVHSCHHQPPQYPC